MVPHTDSAEKLIIGTLVSNFLTTPSITSAKEPAIEVGITTKHFRSEQDKRICLDMDSVAAAKNSAEQGDK
ncbi:hypothetical protein BGX26_008971 [Mortierella sp. AD094]|nr:hypothetical protein BGX26_008971 [Mortierella sp. AD094]